MSGLRERAVVKVGGSLLGFSELEARLTAWLEARRAKNPIEEIVMMAGGGAAADWIRMLDRVYQLGEDSAHALAVQVLDVTAVVLARLVPRSIVIDRLDILAVPRKPGTTPILAPRQILNEIESRRPGASRLPASWDVTSDSIAARIAESIEAQSLILVKSASAPEGTTREGAARLGLVDPMLPMAARSIANVEIVNLRCEPLERRVLAP